MTKITKIIYGKTFNIGNYEAERITLESEFHVVDPSETQVNYVYAELKRRVHELHESG